MPSAATRSPLWTVLWPVTSARLEIKPSWRLRWKSSVSRKFWQVATTQLSTRIAWTFSQPAQQYAASPQSVQVMTGAKVGQTIAFCGLSCRGGLTDDENRSSVPPRSSWDSPSWSRSEEHTSELQ